MEASEIKGSRKREETSTSQGEIRYYSLENISVEAFT